MTAPLTQINIRVPQEVLDLSRALGVNRTEAAIRGLIRTVCDAAGSPDAQVISPDVEAAVEGYLKSRRASLLSEVAEIDDLLTAIRDRAAQRQQKLVEEQLEVRRQEQQAVTVESIRIAKERFDAILRTVPEHELTPLREALEMDDLGDLAATMADELIARNGLTMPSGADPTQWIVDHLVTMRGSV